ncbi:PH, RCC1 and FYVE domains-containing protein 1 [Tanacetum coccineum]
MHGIEESSANNPSKQKACQQNVEPTIKRKGAKDAIKALTSKLQSMSPRAFMRKQAKAHVDTPTCARQLMYSSTHGTCDIEARDINNSCNATPVPVLHTSHGVNTSPSDDTGDKNRGISGSSSLLMNRVPRWGQVSCPASFRKHGIEESSSNNPSKQKACQQSVEPTVKRKGAKDAIKALTSKLQSMSPRAFMRKQAKAHVDTITCARQLMYSLTHGTCDIEARDINNSGNATLLPVLHTIPRWGQVSSPASFRKHGKEESSSNNLCKQKACQQSVQPTVKRKGANDAIKALTSKAVFIYYLQSMSPRAFMRKQAKAHVDTPTCARQLMYSATHGTCDIEARDINNSGNATPVPVLHTSHGVNTSPSDKLVVRSTLTKQVKQIQEWMEQYRPGVYITFVMLPTGRKGIKRVRFSYLS